MLCGIVVFGAVLGLLSNLLFNSPSRQQRLDQRLKELLSNVEEFLYLYRCDVGFVCFCLFVCCVFFVYRCVVGCSVVVVLWCFVQNRCLQDGWLVVACGDLHACIHTHTFSHTYTPIHPYMQYPKGVEYTC